MKPLQNDFTTPEQSKRLLELGVPADSADCYLLRTLTKGDTFIVEVLHDELYSRHDKFTNLLEYLPCWSVGRLMEIFDMCCIKEQTSNTGWCSYRKLHKYQTYIGYVLYVFTINKMQGLLDFSKLKE